MATPDFTLLSNAINNTSVAGMTWIIPLMIVTMSVIMVTRDVEKIKQLYFPMGIAWTIIGVNVGWVTLSISAIVFVISTSSIEILGDVISAAITRTGTGIGDTGVLSKYGRTKRMTEQDEEMDNAGFRGNRREFLIEKQNIYKQEREERAWLREQTLREREEKMMNKLVKKNDKRLEKENKVREIIGIGSGIAQNTFWHDYGKQQPVITVQQVPNTVVEKAIKKNKRKNKRIFG